MQRLIDHIFLLREFDPDCFTAADEQSACILLPVNDRIISNRPDIFTTLFKSGNHFCFYFPEDFALQSPEHIKESILPNIFRLLFLANYCRSAGKYLFYIDPRAQQSATLPWIEKKFRNQGIRPEFRILKKTCEHSPAQDGDQTILDQSLNNYLASDPSQEKMPLAFLSNLTLLLNAEWVIEINGRLDYLQKSGRLDALESCFRRRDPATIWLAEEYKKMQAFNKSLSLDNDQLSFKLATSSEYLSIIRKESMGLVHEIGALKQQLKQRSRNGATNELYSDPTIDDDALTHLETNMLAERKRADETLQWYIKEYEVLPMWYKRFGQLIKVMIGKRTLGSLMNNKPGKNGTIPGNGREQTDGLKH